MSEVKVSKGRLFEDLVQKMMWLQPRFTICEMQSTLDVWSIVAHAPHRGRLVRHDQQSGFYAMIDQLMETMEGLVRKQKGKSMVYRDDMVKHAAAAA